MTSRPRQIRRAAARRGLAALALVAATVGCGTKSPEVTGVTVTAVFSGVVADQLEFSVSTGKGVALMPKRRPDQPDPAHGHLKSPQSISIYLRDEFAREKATVTVTAYFGDGVTATGTGTADLVKNKLVPVLVQLEALSVDGSAPTDGEATDAGDGPADMATETGAGGQDGGGPESPPSLKANGVACGRADECESTLCVDGVCCASLCDGVCEACNLPNKPGTCSPEAAGTPANGACATQPASGCGYDGKCDGSGGCRHHPAGVPCAADFCVQGKPTYQPAGACDGQGTCVVPVAVNCTPYVCDLTSGTPACRAKCRAGQPDCQSPAVCDATGSCGAKPLKGNGEGCAAGTECASTHCVDGVCCAGTCTGACTSCNQMGKEGMCLPVPTGKIDPRGLCVDQGATSCGRNGLCDGASACAFYPATTMCAAGSCNRNALRPARPCDGKGTCAPVTDVNCVPYRCDPAKTACFASCTSNAQCSQAPDKTNCNNGGTCQ